MNARKNVDSSSRTGVNGEFQKRLSPRLHGNLETHKANNSVEPGSVERRFSPRLHKNCDCKVKDSYPQSSLQGMLSSKLSKHQSNTPIPTSMNLTDSKSHTPKVVSKYSNFQRRISPRLHTDIQSKEQKDVYQDLTASLGMSPELHENSASTIQRRLCPRLNQDSASNLREDTCKEFGIQRRLSPRLHSQGETVKQNVTSKGPSGKRRPSDDFHAKNGFSQRRSKHSHPKEDGCSTVSYLDGRMPAGNGETPTPLAARLNALDKKEKDSYVPKEDGCSMDSYLNGTTSTSNGEPPSQLAVGLNVLDKKEKKDGDVPDAAWGSVRARVKETLTIFNTYYLQIIQEEEERRKKRETVKGKKGEASNSKEKDVKWTSNLPDLKAISKMRQKKEILYPEKRIGHIPGVDVGYQFFSRAEMFVVGIHSHLLNGVDYIGQSGGKREHQHYSFPIAVAVILPGQCEEDLVNSEDIIYTGQGGHDLLGSKLQCEDKVLHRGNLAMKNSMEQSVPVRVIRGHTSASSYSGKIYSYDGLYKVVETWADSGCRGHVYKYRLKQLGAQSKLNQVQCMRGCQCKTLSEVPGLVCHDISIGQEDICIPVTNLFDDSSVGPPGFIYIKSIQVAESVDLPSNALGCACKGSCTNPDSCACAKLNGADFPYIRRDGGRLVEPKDVVFECGPKCGCGPACLNRTSQRGIKYHLEVYRTPDKGWAVRSWDFIPSGAPVCEYVGVLRRTDELDNISGNDYIFEIDCWHTMNEVEGRERRYGNLPPSATNILPKVNKMTVDSTPEFCIDAGSTGNIARFINHSCEPNLFVQCILSSHHDLRLARLVLFAADDIPPMQELTYDYGYALNSVIGPDGKFKVLPCFCGTADCRKRLY